MKGVYSAWSCQFGDGRLWREWRWGTGNGQPRAGWLWSDDSLPDAIKGGMSGGQVNSEPGVRQRHPSASAGGVRLGAWGLKNRSSQSRWATFTSERPLPEPPSYRVSLVSREYSEKNDILYTHPPKTGLAGYRLDLVHLAVVHLLAKSFARVFPSVGDTRHGKKRLTWTSDAAADSRPCSIEVSPTFRDWRWHGWWTWRNNTSERRARQRNVIYHTS